MPDELEPSKMEDKQFREFEFYEKQLGTLDKKANNVIFIDSVLILVTTLASLFNQEFSLHIRVLSSVSTVGVLVSAGFSIRIIWTTWSTSYSDIKKITTLRDNKTKYLQGALISLLASLVLFIALIFAGMFEGVL